MLKKLIHLLRNPSSRYSLGLLLIIGAVGGIIFLLSFNWSVEMSSKEEFCTSCHEMSWVYEEYKDSVHYKNTSGVQATCSDCHVPKAWPAKMARKIKATLKEVPRTISGKINTKEKFEAHRLELAESVWAVMKENDSLECRNCHVQEAMDLASQDKSASKRHSMERRAEKGETCIDCHKGIAHTLPGAHGEP
jgi:nitrate/TMAO reductase-like tetraheme cytochrome c subunit|tara:strand:- start:618 stop:1193 length:576 start_codon:yes stop_codon:yes gene_type:complete